MLAPAKAPKSLKKLFIVEFLSLLNQGFPTRLFDTAFFSPAEAGQVRSGKDFIASDRCRDEQPWQRMSRPEAGSCMCNTGIDRRINHHGQTLNQGVVSQSGQMHPARIRCICCGQRLGTIGAQQLRHKIDDNVMEALNSPVSQGQDTSGAYRQTRFLHHLALTTGFKGFPRFKPASRNVPESRLWRLRPADQQDPSVRVEHQTAYTHHWNGGFCITHRCITLEPFTAPGVVKYPPCRHTLCP